ncbi:hypothetical protein SAMN04487830_10815 [Pseudobutyrivibrio sp. OR37]|nr:hypothetical protein SAMN04487830_10815 [Pseudobutyrivibrio sp. OR37]
MIRMTPTPTPTPNRNCFIVGQGEVGHFLIAVNLSIALNKLKCVTLEFSKSYI